MGSNFPREAKHVSSQSRIFARFRYGQASPDNPTYGRGIGNISFGAQMWLIKPPAEGSHCS